MSNEKALAISFKCLGDKLEQIKLEKGSKDPLKLALSLW